MEITKVLFIMLLLSALRLPAQHYYQVSGGAQAAMGGAGVAGVDVFSAVNNQAAMAFYQARWGAGFYYQNSFMTSATALNQGAFVVPLTGGSLGLSISSFGTATFNTRQLGLGYGHRFGKRFAVGLRLDYISVFLADNYGKRGLFTFDLSLFSKPTERLNVGFHVFNPIRAGLADYNDERLPLIMNIGGRWKAAEGLILVAEAESDIEHPLVVKGGVEYQLVQMLYVRMGLATGPAVFSFGAGLHLGNLHLDFSSSMHQVLGYSPQLSLSYDFD